MKVQIKDLKPNPFRDMENYPINEEKVQSLVNSINQTGFWDNILGRLGKKGYFDGWGEESQYVGKFNRKKESLDIIEGGYPVRWEWVGKIEIAYGHHRLIALQRIYKPNDYVDIPVKELDDPTMIRIMANENDESWGTSPKIINETVKVVKKYLEEHLEIIKSMGFRAPVGGRVGDTIISRFLGGNWNTTRIQNALERLGFGEYKDIDTEATEIFEKDTQARTFVKAVKEVKNVTPEQQKQTAKRIVERQDFSESGIKSALLDEKYRGKEKGKEERDFIEFKNYVMGCTKEINTLNGKLGKLLLLEEELKPDMLLYRGSIEARDFDSALRLLISILKGFLGKGETECQKQIVSKQQSRK